MLLNCKSCGNSFEGKYCNLCGEKVLEPKEKSLKYFFEKILHMLILVDNKFLFSLRLVLSKPGFLSKEYAKGIRKKYYKPLSLFFVANLLYFLFPIFETFNTTLNSQLKHSQHREIANIVIQKKMQKEKISFEKLKEKYEIQSTNLAKLLIILIVFLFAIPLSLLYYSKNIYFVDHLTLSLEYNSFNLFVNNIFLPFLIIPLIFIFDRISLDIRPFLNDSIFSFIIATTSGYFFYKASQRFYQNKKWISFLKIFLLIFVLIFILEVYRFILFFATIWTI